jgi:hypothetical protein
MEVSNKVRVRTIQIDFDPDIAPSKNIDAIDERITDSIEAHRKEGFKVTSMTSLASNGTTYAIVIVFEPANLFE